jgi:hypothetical protein
MKRKSWFVKLLVFVAVLLAVALGISAAAVAWSEGNPATSKTGTHDWIIGVAKVVANANQAGSANWLDVSVAQSYSHYPDEVYKDLNNHAYDVWGLLRLGNAPNTVKSHWTAAVKALKAKDLSTASKEVGLMAHYYDDIWNPWHTTYEFTNVATQTRYHSVYESDVLGKEPASVTPDGYQTVTDAAVATKSAAGVSRNYYSVLASAYTSGKGYAGANVDATTRLMLGKAANGLADLIIGIKVAAGYAG